MRQNCDKVAKIIMILNLLYSYRSNRVIKDQDGFKNQKG